jgi:hypothetical protein
MAVAWIEAGVEQAKTSVLKTIMRVLYIQAVCPILHFLEIPNK